MNIDKLKESIYKYEGCELKPYKCPKGKSTIGFGRNLQDRGITFQEANTLLENDLELVKNQLNHSLPFFKFLDDVRQNVLIEMAYNMGTPKLLEFKNTLKYIENKDYEKASVEMLDSQWHRDFLKYDAQDGKKNNNGLLRSEYLSQLMKKGEF